MSIINGRITLRTGLTPPKAAAYSDRLMLGLADFLEKNENGYVTSARSDGSDVVIDYCVYSGQTLPEPARDYLRALAQEHNATVEVEEPVGSKIQL